MTIFLSHYWRALRGHHKHALINLFFIGLAGLLEGTALLVLIPILGQGLSSPRHLPVDRYAHFYQLLHIPQAHRLTYSFLAFILVGFTSAVSKMIADTCMAHLGVRLVQSYREAMGKALFAVNWSYYVSLRQGEISKSFFLESQNIAEGCGYYLSMLGVTFVAMVFIGISFFISTPLTLITFAFGGLASVGYLWGSRRAGNHARNLSQSASGMGDYIAEIFNNLKFIRSSGSTAAIERETHRWYARYAESNFKSEAYRSIVRFSVEMSGILLISGFLAYGFFWSGKPIEWVLVFLAVFYRLSPRVQAIQDFFYSARMRLPWLSDWESRYERLNEHQDAPTGNRAVPALSSILLENVAFRYPSSAGATLQDINLEIAKGQYIALVGESGSGKSTVIDLCAGLLRPAAGRILLQNIPLEEVQLNSWQSRIGLVLQGSPLLHGTVLDNITWGQDIPDETKAVECARMAHAWEFIERLPQGIHTEVEEKGGRLSGGQRQRIALARALYREPWLLLLDEPTSELDGESEEVIIKALSSLKGRHAILIASHRLPIVRMADEIVVLQKGQICERGSWEQLMAKPKGVFQKLARQPDPS